MVLLFIYRNGFSIHKITHIGQYEKIDSKEHIDKFFKLLMKLRINLYYGSI